MENFVTLWTDGSCNNKNPNGMGMGIVIKRGDHKLKYISRCDGVNGKASSNLAEYLALLQGISLIIGMRIYNIQCYSDSQLMVKGILGDNRVLDPNLLRLNDLILQIININNLSVGLSWIPRENNKEADKLSKQALQCDPSIYQMHTITL